MPTDVSDETDEVEDDAGSQSPDQLRAALKRHKARATELEAQAAQTPHLQKVVTAYKAGIDPETPLGKMFIGQYDGEDTTEAMKAAYAALGVAPAGDETPPPGDGANDGPTPEEQELQRRRTAMHGEAAPPGGEPLPPLWDDIFSTFQDNMKSGMARDRAGASALTLLLEAAADPTNPRHDQAIFDPERWRQDNVE